MKILGPILALLSGEARSQHCKFYAEPTLKQAIESLQHREGMPSFSDACRVALLNSPEIQHEIRVLKGEV